MAYITSYNSYKIVKRSNLMNAMLEGEVYKRKIYIFNRYEEHCLLAIQELLKDPDKYFTEIYSPIVVTDTLEYVYREHQPAYHTNLNCPQLHADFKNFVIPKEIRLRGIQEIERFRKWFKENEYLMEKPDVFVMKLNIAFGIKYNPRAINYENSGFSKFDNYTVLDLEEMIDNLLRDAGRFYYRSQKHTSIIRSFGKLSALAFKNNDFNNDLGYTNEEVRELLEEYYVKFKRPIKNLLIEYYRIKLNPDLEFAENLLEALGFKKCGKCNRFDFSTHNQPDWHSINRLLSINVKDDWEFDDDNYLNCFEPDWDTINDLLYREIENSDDFNFSNHEVDYSISFDMDTLNSLWGTSGDDSFDLTILQKDLSGIRYEALSSYKPEGSLDQHAKEDDDLPF